MKDKLIKHARLLFFAALFLSPLMFFTNLTRNPYLIQERILQVFLAFSLLMLLFGAYKKRQIVLPRTFLDGPLWIFFIVSFLSIVISLFRYGDYRLAIAGYSGRSMLMLIFSGMIPFYFAAGTAREGEVTDRIMRVVISAGTIASLYALMQFLKLDFIWPRNVEPYGQRSISTFGNPNFLSSFLLIAIFWIIGNIFSGKRSLSWFAVLILNLTGLAITMTRSTYLGLLAGLVIFIVILLKSHKRQLRNFRNVIYFLVTVLVLATGIFSAVSSQFSDRIKSFFSIEKMGAAFTQRVLIWESAYNMFKDTPVIGRGWGNFEIFFPFYQGRLIDSKRYRELRTHANNAHNILMEYLTQVGIIGTGIYIWLIAVFVSCAKRLYTVSEDKERIWVVILAVAGISFWIDNILNVSLFFPMPALAFWLNAGLLAGMWRKAAGYPELKISTGKTSGLLLAGVTVIAAGVVYFNYVYFLSSVHFFRGFKYSRQNRLDLAEKELKKCLKIYPFNVDNNYELGNVYARSGEDASSLQKAVRAYEDALKANPGYDEIYFNLGVVYIRQGKMEKAEEYIGKAVEINPLLADGWRSLGDIRANEKDYGRAIVMYDKAIGLNPSDESLWNNRGYYSEQEGNETEALRSYLNSLKIKPRFKPARNNLAKLAAKYAGDSPADKIASMFASAEKHIRKKEWTSSLADVEGILKINPLNMKALLYAGNISFEMGNMAAAKEYYETILCIDPSSKEAARNMQVIESITK
ncbi:MAG: tetratricopeptide repeat protein [Elusimicrobia bacterium]|nr:tetratricopeptide repeat protein [Elusimicrobiota bacterium]